MVGIVVVDLEAAAADVDGDRKRSMNEEIAEEVEVGTTITGGGNDVAVAKVVTTAAGVSVVIHVADVRALVIPMMATTLRLA